MFLFSKAKLSNIQTIQNYLASSIFLMVLLLSGCMPQQRPDLLTISGPFEAITLDPSKTGYIFTRMQVIETLVNVNDNGQLIPGLASHWQVSEDGLTWRFWLRSDVIFHDGNPMTTKEVVHSLNTAFSKPAPFSTNIISQINSAPDNSVIITLRLPYQPFAAILSNYTTAILASSSYDKQNNIQQLIGTGPYKIKEFEPPHAIEVIKFDQYYGPQAHIPEVRYITGHRSESRALMVENGDADIVYNLDPASIKFLQHSKNVRLDSTPIPRTISIKVNCADNFLQHIEARQALSLALDRYGITEGIMHQQGTAANQLFGPSMQDWHINELPDPIQDISQAKQLLEQIGWTVDQTGKLQRDGNYVSLSIITYANRPELIVIATAIQAQWAKLGINLQVHMENVSAIPSGHADGSLQLALMARNIANIPDPLALLLADFSSTEGGDWGAMNWDNPSFFQQLSQLDTSDIPKKQLSEEIAISLPLIPISYYVQQSAVTNRVKNFSFDPYERSFRLSQMEIVQP